MLSLAVLTYKMSQTTPNITKTCNKCTNFIKTIKATTQFVVFLFVHSWEQRKLGEVSPLRGGFAFKSEEYLDAGIPVVRISNILTDGTVGADFAYYNRIENDENMKLHNGDAVLAMSGATTGKVSILHCKNDDIYYQNQRVGYFTYNKNYDYKYISIIVRSPKFIDQLSSVLVAGAQPNVSSKDIDSFEFKFPTEINEQSKIGKLFEQLDNLITLHQCKDFSLKSVFEESKNFISALRKNASWEQRKLGDITQIIMGQSPDGSTYSDFPTDYILVQGNADLENGWVKPRIWTTQKTKYAVAGDLIMSVRAPAGSMGKTAYNVVLGRGVAAIKGNEFIFQVLTKMDLEGFWKKLSAGSTFESLNSDNIINANINLPSNLEQDKIGSIFENIDNLITLHQRIKIFFTGDYHDKKNK